MSVSNLVIGRAVGLAIGQVIDRTCGEPPPKVHPLVHVGNGLDRLERHTYRDRRLAGVAHLAIAVGAAAACGSVLGRISRPWLATAITVSIASSSKMLGDTAHGVADADDLGEARLLLRSLVGRRTDELSEPEIARAAIESVAENTVDGVTATAFWAIVGGAPMVCVHRIVNTLDAMVGHRNQRYERFGWASARLDDVLNWVPARLTALAVAAVNPPRFVEVLRVIRRDGGSHPSPNGGRIEAAVAASLGVILGGVNQYGNTVEIRGVLGDGRPPAITDIRRAVRLTRTASALVTVVVTSSIVMASRFA